jgi:hypothetical protein
LHTAAKELVLDGESAAGSLAGEDETAGRVQVNHTPDPSSRSALRPRPHRLHIPADGHETLLRRGTGAAFAAALRAHLVATHGTPDAADTGR